MSAGADLRAHAAAFFDRSARLPELALAARDRRDLADRWLEEAYQAELAGNPKRLRYIFAWVGRV